MTREVRTAGDAGTPSAYHSARSLRTWLTIALAACGVLYSLGSVADTYGRVTFPTWDSDIDVTSPTEMVLLLFVGLCGTALLLVALPPAIILFCFWVRRANRNARTLGAQGMRFTPGWAVGWFFIPVMNLFRPYQVVKEIWETSDPDRGPNDWRGADSTLVGAWWGFWLLTNLGGRALERLGQAAEFRLSLALGVAAIDAALFGVATVLACYVVRGVVRRQEHKAQIAEHSAPP